MYLSLSHSSFHFISLFLLTFLTPFYFSTFQFSVFLLLSLIVNEGHILLIYYYILVKKAIRLLIKYQFIFCFLSFSFNLQLSSLYLFFIIDRFYPGNSNSASGSHFENQVNYFKFNIFKQTTIINPNSSCYFRITDQWQPHLQRGNSFSTKIEQNITRKKKLHKHIITALFDLIFKIILCKLVVFQ